MYFLKICKNFLEIYIIYCIEKTLYVIIFYLYNVQINLQNLQKTLMKRAKKYCRQKKNERKYEKYLIKNTDKNSD